MNLPFSLVHPNPPPIAINNAPAISNHLSGIVCSPSLPAHFALQSANTGSVGDAPLPDEDDHDDEIIQRIPVFFNSDLAHSLYVVQQPLRPLGRSYACMDTIAHDTGMAKFKSKPIQKKIGVEYNLKQKQTAKHENSLLFSSKHGLKNEINENYDVNHEKSIESFKYIGKNVQPKTNYCIGVMKENQLHLSLIHSVNRLKPDFDFIDDMGIDDTYTHMQSSTIENILFAVAAVHPLLCFLFLQYMPHVAVFCVECCCMLYLSLLLTVCAFSIYVFLFCIRAEKEHELESERKKEEHREEVRRERYGGGAGSDSEDDDDGSDDGMKKEDDLKVVSMKVKRKETERSTQIRKQSYAYLKHLEENEPWMDMKLIDSVKQHNQQLLIACNSVLGFFFFFTRFHSPSLLGATCDFVCKGIALMLYLLPLWFITVFVLYYVCYICCSERSYFCSI